MKVSDIVYEKGQYWVYRDNQKKQYTVFETGITHSTSDSAYALDEDGLSIAKARADYLEKRKQARELQAVACH